MSRKPPIRFNPVRLKTGLLFLSKTLKNPKGKYETRWGYFETWEQEYRMNEDLTWSWRDLRWID